MNLNGINNSTYTEPATTSTVASTKNNQSTKTTESANKDVYTDEGVVYEKSDSSSNKTAKTYTKDTNLINKLKADADERTSQLRSLVESLITKQGKTFDDANMWSLIREGNYKVDSATVEQAKKDISEDGYWGVKQTSERILSFAKALTGGDPSKIDTMRKAVEKGFKQATKSWGDKLPSITNDTYDAIMKGFDEWEKEGQEEN